MDDLRLSRRKSGEQTLPAQPETPGPLPLLPAPAAEEAPNPLPLLPAPAAAEELSQEDEAAPPASAAAAIPQEETQTEEPDAKEPGATEPGGTEPGGTEPGAEESGGEEPGAVEADWEPVEIPAAVATVTDSGLTVYGDGEAAELLPADGKTTGRMPVATATPEGGVRMLVPPEGNGEYLTAGQVERLLHAAYMRGRNEAVAARMEADTTIGTLPQRDDDVLFSTRPSVWDRPQ